MPELLIFECAFMVTLHAPTARVSRQSKGYLNESVLVIGRTSCAGTSKCGGLVSTKLTTTAEAGTGFTAGLTFRLFKKDNGF